MRFLQIVFLVYLGWLVLINIITANAYMRDKRAAQQNKWRVPERTLFQLNWLGGVGGAWLIFLWLHHKTRKPAFWTVQILATILHVFGLVCLIIFGYYL